MLWRHEEGPWGDGFHHDTLQELARVKCLRLVSDDELVRVFPKLEGPAATSARVEEQLEKCLSVLYHLELLAGRSPQIRSLPASEAAERGRASAARWFGSGRRLLIFRPSRAAKSPGPQILGFVDSVLSEVRNASLRSYRDEECALLAYHAAIHPFYIWPEALARADVFAAIAWLGIVRRGRAAMVPPEIAELLLQVVDNEALERELHPYIGRWKEDLTFVRKTLKKANLIVKPSAFMPYGESSPAFA